MSKPKKANSTDKPAIQISRTRGGGGKKKPDLFANLRGNIHPLDDMFPKPDFPAAVQNEENNLGTKIKDVGDPIKINLETQNEVIGSPKYLELETQITKIGNPTVEILETQINKAGNPTIESLGANAPKSEFREPKSEPNLGANAPEEKSLGTQKIPKAEKFRKYEKARSTISMHIRADEGIVKQVKHFIIENETEVPNLKEFFELAAMKFIETFGDPTNSGLGTNAPYDDRRLKIAFKTKGFIVNLYLKFCPKNRWKPRDDTIACKFNEVNPKIIELGMLQTLGNKKSDSKINSFAYFIPEIENWMANALPEETMDTVIAVYRKRINLINPEIPVE